MSLEACKIIANDITIIYENGETDTIDARNIESFSIEKDFFSDYLPVFYFKCLVDSDQYKKINSNVAKFKIEIFKYFTPSSTDNTLNSTNNNSVIKKKFINDIFINVNNSDTLIDPSEEFKENIDKESERTELEKENIEIELLLFQINALDYKKFNDKIFINTDVCHAIMALAQLTNQDKLLLSYPDNKQIYDNIVLPGNLTFLGGIKFMQSVYGIYNTDYLLFKDFDKTYLINKDTKCNAYVKNEYKRVYINYSDMSNQNGNIYGQEKDTKNKLWKINCINQPDIKTNDTGTNELSFNNLYTANTISGGYESNKINLTKQSNIENSKVIDNKYNNNFVVNSLLYNIELKNYEITLNFNEIDLDILTPNKEYYLNIDIPKVDYKKINGLIKLSKLIAVYQKQDDNSFSCGIKAIFNRS